MTDTELEEAISEDEMFEEVARRADIDPEAFQYFCENQHIDADECEDAVRDFMAAYIGEFSNDEDFARNYYDESGDLDRIPDALLSNIDWQGVWDGELRHEFYELNRYYFRNI